MRTSRYSVVVAALLAINSFGCAGKNSWESPAPSRNIITSEEIERARVSSAWEVVIKLRGNFMHSRGANSLLVKVNKEPTVFLDGVEYGNLGTLKQIPASVVSEIRFIEGWNAQSQFGPGHAAGVIQVFTRVQ